MKTRRIIFGVGEEFMRRERLEDQPQPWEDGQRCPTYPGWFEWWYFDVSFEDGSTAVIVFMTKPLLQRNGPLHPAVSITVTPPAGKPEVFFQYYPAREFFAEKEVCAVRIGPNHVHGDLKRCELHAEAGNFKVDLVFNSRVPAWRPGTGMNYYSEDLERFFGWLAAIPYGAVSGSLTLNGREALVSGTGYHDHNWGNIGLPQVMSHWYWGRAHLEDFTAIFVEMSARPAYGRVKIPVFMLAQGDRILIGDGAPLRLETADFARHPSRRSYPRRLDFIWEKPGEGRVRLALRQPQVIEASSLLIGLSPWLAGLARLAINPYYFRFRADLELSIELNGVRELIRGPAIYELMQLR